MSTSKEQIKSKALDLLEDNRNGIRYSDLVKMIHEEFQDISINTIRGTVWNLDTQEPEKVYKPARGLFRHTQFMGEGVSEEESTPSLVTHM